LLKEAENDPIAKARLITDVIRSVAVIPEAITRSVYIKDCSKLLDVSEEVLYTEVRKQKRRQDEDFRKREERKKTIQQPKKEVVTVEPPSDMRTEDLEFLRFLLKHGNAAIRLKDQNESYETTVKDFMIGEIEADELVSENALFKKIFYDVAEQIDNDDFDPWKFFVYHSEGEVSKLATDLLSDKYIESKRWAKAGAYTEKEEDILDVLIPRIVNEYKLSKVKIMLTDIEKEITEASAANDFDRVIEEQSVYMNLKRVEKELSRALGRRAIN
jgi:DNA primase